MANDHKPTEDYMQGQMMGMLCIIQMFENAKDAGVLIQQTQLDIIKRIAVQSLAPYLQKPEEDIMLLVDQQLKENLQ